MPKKKITVTKENKTGRNTDFVINRNGKKVNRPELVKEIKNGKHPDYHVRNINGVPTPVSNPDNTTGNNLG